MSDIVLKLTASDLAALLCARVCHDLVGPVGALVNGVSLLDDEDSADMHEDAIDLIKVGTAQASAKLKFLRISFGGRRFSARYNRHCRAGGIVPRRISGRQNCAGLASGSGRA